MSKKNHCTKQKNKKTKKNGNCTDLYWSVPLSIDTHNKASKCNRTTRADGIGAMILIYVTPSLEVKPSGTVVPPPKAHWWAYSIGRHLSSVDVNVCCQHFLSFSI